MVFMPWWIVFILMILCITIFMAIAISGLGLWAWFFVVIGFFLEDSKRNGALSKAIMKLIKGRKG